jgi:SAM-dependent methyltransferase
MDPRAEAHARRQGHGYFCGRIEDFEAAERFDLVLLLNLIEHVADPERVLARLRAALSEHGVILVKTPNHDSLDARCFRRHNWAGYHCPRHWVLFERESFRALAARAGLAVRELRYTQGAAFWANSVLFALAERGLVSITRERPAMSHPLFPLLAAPFAAFDLARAACGGRPSQMFVTLTRA